MLGLHGGIAENGELQAMCEARGIPFTGSGSASSHLSFDKVAAKRFAAYAGVVSPSGVSLEDAEAALAAAGNDTKLAILMILTGQEAETARANLVAAGGVLRRAIAGAAQ